jgi:hypothetical protein
MLGRSLTLRGGHPTMLPVGPRPGARGGLEVRSCSRLFIGGPWVGPRSAVVLEVVGAHSGRAMGWGPAVPGWFR